MRFWLRIDSQGAHDIQYLTVKVGSGDTAFINLAYQEILGVGGPRHARDAYLQSIFKPGTWTAITLGPPSFAGIGDENFSYVNWDQLQDFELALAALPGSRASFELGGFEVLPGDPRFRDGVVSFTFDDGLSSPYRLGFPILRAYGMPATAYVIRDLIGTGTASDSYMSQSQLAELTRHGWEIAAHANTIADHNGHLGFAGLPLGRVSADVRDEVAWLRASGYSGARDLALPQGWFTAPLIRRLRAAGHFRTIRTVDYRSVETTPPADPLALRARVYDPTQKIGPRTHPGSALWLVDQVARYGGWLILGFHDMSSHAESSEAPIVNEGTAIVQHDFAAIVEHVHRRGVPVQTVGEVYEMGRGSESRRSTSDLASDLSSLRG
jgi:peptidoglycan/xylan/chitin deacetylase (PgdA/CDA1 family)